MKILLSTLPNEGQYISWLTNPTFRVEVNKYMPLGILSLATNLPQEHDIKVIDPASEDWSIDKTISIIENEEPDILGISAVTRRVYALKEILSRINVPYITVGGPHATHYSEQILEYGADAVFVGPLADNEFRYNLNKKARGIIYCKTGINEIKFPNREFLEVNKYFPKAHKLFVADNRLPMFSSIGCPNKCLFCNVQTKKIQLKNSNIILDEMEYLKSLNCNSVHMLDDNFNVSKKHLNSIIKEFKERDFNIEWSGRGQVKMDLSMLSKLKEVGFKRMHVGIEALDDNILKYFNKNQTVNDIENFCREMTNLDLDIIGYFIFGSPVETKEYRKNVIKKIRDLNINKVLCHVLFPQPNTGYYFELLNKGTFKEDYWKKYMEGPTPNYELPYPFGEEYKNEIWNFMEDLKKEFKYI